jgi:hypothetical protein
LPQQTSDPAGNQETLILDRQGTPRSPAHRPPRPSRNAQGIEPGKLNPPIIGRVAVEPYLRSQLRKASQNPMAAARAPSPPRRGGGGGRRRRDREAGEDLVVETAALVLLYLVWRRGWMGRSDREAASRRRKKRGEREGYYWRRKYLVKTDLQWKHRNQRTIEILRSRSTRPQRTDCLVTFCINHPQIRSLPYLDQPQNQYTAAPTRVRHGGGAGQTLLHLSSHPSNSAAWGSPAIVRGRQPIRWPSSSAACPFGGRAPAPPAPPVGEHLRRHPRRPGRSTLQRTTWIRD